MMLNNIFDYMVDGYGTLEPKSFHIPDISHYKELGFPFYIDGESGVIMDNLDQPAIMTIDLIDSLEWEVVDD